jgi:hypothetical protein
MVRSGLVNIDREDLKSHLASLLRLLSLPAPLSPFSSPSPSPSPSPSSSPSPTTSPPPSPCPSPSISLSGVHPLAAMQRCAHPRANLPYCGKSAAAPHTCAYASSIGPPVPWEEQSGLLLWVLQLVNQPLLGKQLHVGPGNSWSNVQGTCRDACWHTEGSDGCRLNHGLKIQYAECTKCIQGQKW